MSHDAGLHRPISPASSGRSSPASFRPRFATIDGIDRKDKYYRRYTSAVERALSLFDSTLQDWADYIPFLGRLHKALQLKPATVAEVPHRDLVAKRLAQCLHPALPNGVHQKAIEVYSCIFSILGTNGLAKDLPIYLPGLSSTLTFASLSMRPAILSLFEGSILPLDNFVLRPALKAIILALLPGLEEETSEEFERTQAILNRFKAAVRNGSSQITDTQDVSSEQYFWQCLFLATITSTSRRQGALAYISRNLPQLGDAIVNSQASKTDEHLERESGHRESLALGAKSVITPEPGLLIRCLAAGLRDEHLLVQRGFLDLLVSHLPLHSPVLQEKVTSRDLESLVDAASSVTARREMSLNRRLWTWFLGPDFSAAADKTTSSLAPLGVSEGSASPTDALEAKQSWYFHRFGFAPLVQSIMSMIENESLLPSEKARPFRICLSLMDRWDIGGAVVRETFLPMMRSVWLYQQTAPSQEAFNEVHRSASVFFDAVESGLIWGEIVKTLMTSLGEKASPAVAQNNMEMILFLVTTFSVREEEMRMLHIPLALSVLITCLKQSMHRSPKVLSLDHSRLHSTALRVSMQLQDLVSERAYAQEMLASQQLVLQEDDVSVIAERECLNEVCHFYMRDHANAKQIAPPPKLIDIARLILQNTVQVVLRDLLNNGCMDYMELELGLFDSVIRKTAFSKFLDLDTMLLAFTQALDIAPDMMIVDLSVRRVSLIVSALETLSSISPSKVWSASFKLRQLVGDLIRKVWQGVSPSTPNCNVEAARCIWRLHSILSLSQQVEGSIVTLLTMSIHERKPLNTIEMENARRFATLWAHSTTPLSNSHGSARPRSARRSRQRPEGPKEQPATYMSLLGRPLLLVLDSLHEPRTPLFVFVVNWLRSLSNTQMIVDYLMLRLKSTNYLTLNGGGRSPRAADAFSQENSSPEECLYYLMIIENLIVHSPEKIWESLAISTTSPIDHEKSVSTTKKSENADHFDKNNATLQDELAHICLSFLNEHSELDSNDSRASMLRQIATNILQKLLEGPHSASIVRIDIIDAITKALRQSIRWSDPALQVSLMDLIVVILRANVTVQHSVAQPYHRKSTSGEALQTLPRLSSSLDGFEGDASTDPLHPPPALLDCILLGLSSDNAYPVLENWVQFLDSCLPFYAGAAFQILMPLVDCFNRTIRSVFQLLQSTFEGSANASTTSDPLATLVSLLNGLERALARAHERLVQHEAKPITTKTPELTQGFFGTMVSGVFTPGSNRSRSAAANKRLTVLLCFKDAVQVCYEMWNWGDIAKSDPSRYIQANSGSFNYTSIRLKNRLRRILEHLFDAEPLECLESVILLWLGLQEEQSATVLNLLHALDGSRPKNTIPAIFNAMYSRTNPNAIDPGRKSSLTSDLSDISVAGFLVAYMQSLEDDAMDEIWSDCMTFLRDVLGNPLPHRQILARLLEFTAILGHKIGNTNFGEQRGMRRDLGDLFVRLLAATFTIKPLNFASETAPPVGNSKLGFETPGDCNSYINTDANDIVAVLARSVPRISKVLMDTDRMAAAYSTISTQLLVPTIRSKSYPHNVTKGTLDILHTMSRVSEVSKSWRKDVAEAFNDARFFNLSTLPLVTDGWIPVLRQWALLDKERVPDLLSRLSPPSSAGIVFGVGASSARVETDRKTQLNLRRLALLILAGTDDGIIANLNVIYERLSELMSATSTSSPSSATRMDIYMLLRALLLKTSAIHLVSFWPIVDSELYDVISSLSPNADTRDCNINGVLHACKLLDTLLVLDPDEFQLREWLFITDTVDAVHRPPSSWGPVALIDDLAESLDSRIGARHESSTPTVGSLATSGKRKPLLGSDAVTEVPREEVLDHVLRPFFRQLSISAFESTYSREAPDWKACYDILLSDLFNDFTIA